MPIVIIVQLAALAVIVIIAACVLYETVRMRDAYIEQRREFARAISIIKDFQRLYPEMTSLLERLDSVDVAGKAQKADLPESRPPHNSKEDLARNMPEVVGNQNNDSALMRRGILSQDPNLRFGVLKNWLAKNSLAVLRRAAHEWKTADDLIAMIPSVLEPEAEIVDGRVLLVGTRGHDEKLEIPIREANASSITKVAAGTS
jgi:hypothetical protein